jgi:SOS-response transcriptional repressor LexA
MRIIRHPEADPGEKARTLGTLIRSARLRKGLTLQDLATTVGCAKSYLSQLETGFRPGSGVSHALLGRLERALDLAEGDLVFVAQWEATPGPVRRELARAESRRRAAADQLRELLSRRNAPAPSTEHTLDDLSRSGRLRELIDQIADPDHAPPNQHAAAPTPACRGLEAISLAVEVPLINSVAAGYPCDFTDLGYPARVADEYVRVPDVRDADAFAARVVGDSMMPDYREGDIVVFSPARQLKDGMDCFVRLEPDHQSTFKRIFFESAPPAPPTPAAPTDAPGSHAPAHADRDGPDALSGELIRLQPLNPRYPPMTLPRERVAGLYAAVSVTRMV